MAEGTGGEKWFHVLVKPIGSTCNLRCTYCYYLGKEHFIGAKGTLSIPDDILESFVHQYINMQDSDIIEFSWQGGEPTLLGIEFFEKVLKLQRKHAPPRKRVSNTIQTNGVLIDDDWCAFLRDHQFLVGLSIDGPRDLHDEYRKDSDGNPTNDRALRAAQLFNRHGVDFNTLTVINRINAAHPHRVYEFLRDVVGSRYMQFIPCVEQRGFERMAPPIRSGESPMNEQERPSGSPATEWSVDPKEYGDFLCGVFDQWITRDVGEVYVITFEAALACWMGLPPPLCTVAPVCGSSLALEKDGGVYSCDHYVYPEHRLGSIKERTLSSMAFSERQVRFGQLKRERLTEHCRRCEYLFACNGDCPKNRFVQSPDGGAGLSYLCSGLRQFYQHIDPWMRLMASELRAGRPLDRTMTHARMVLPPRPEA